MKTDAYRVILVAGYDYSSLQTMRQEVSFTSLCLKRARALVEAAEHTRSPGGRPLVFTLFDVKSGRVLAGEPNGGGYRWRTIARYAPVSPTNYTDGQRRRKVFSHSPGGVLSILDVYRFVMNIGSTEGPAIRELSVFSHGWVGGMCLVNSDETHTSNRHPDARDPNDKDGRRKDFAPPNMSPCQLRAFRSAFHESAYSWIWSCAVNASSADVLYQMVYGQGSTVSANVESLPQNFSFNFSRGQGEHYFRVDTEFFPKLDSAVPESFTFHRTMHEVKRFLRGRLNDTYAQQLATASGVVCYGALSGTYATSEQVGRLALIVVPTRKPPYYDDFSEYLRIYERHLEVRLDPESRGFGAYAPAAAG